MKVTYTGKSDALNAKQRSKLEVKLQKLSKMLERKGEKEAHVILTQVRYLHKVEITLNAMEHSMVGAGSDGDVLKAAHAALERLEKQVLKQKNKWRDTKRNGGKAAQPAAPMPPAKTAKPAKTNGAQAASAKNGSGGARKKVFRVNPGDGNKPMTLEEAMLEMEASQDYMVYRDAQTDKVTVLMRRTDGHFDLIES